MTRHGYGKHIRATRLRDGSHRFRETDPFCHFGIAGRLPHWNSLQFLPHPLLEGGSANVQGQVQSDFRRLDKTNNLRDDLFITFVATNEIGLRKLVL
jgi:hypothetical protein